MAHFAEIQNDIVVRVLVVSDDEDHRGPSFLADDLGLGGEWIQCSYNGKIRKQYPGTGYRYDRIADVFIAPQPFPSWSLDANHDWQPPIQKPEYPCEWDEGEKQWKAIP